MSCCIMCKRKTVMIVQIHYESLWQYYRDNPNNNITQSESFKSKIKITGKTPADGNTKMLK